jgi:lipopolysaccharide export system permease protein
MLFRWPILWRYLLRSYFQILMLSVAAFVGVLIVMRFQEIARFATSGAAFYKVIGFGLLQIPYILPIALPTSCLISTLLLIQRLSHTHELTALRSCGVSLKNALTPLILASLFLSMINGLIASEVSPRCRALSKELVFGMATANPLFLLQKDSPVKMKHTYCEIGKLRDNTHAKDLLLFIKSNSTDRIALVAFKELSINDDLVLGKQVSLISHAKAEGGDIKPGFDHLVIENEERMQTKAALLSQFLHSADWKASYEYLPLRLLLASKLTRADTQGLKKGAKLELYRRLAVGFAPLAFTLIGLSCGIEIGRNRSNKGILWALCLAALFFSCLMAAKSMERFPLIGALLFFAPYLLIFGFCMRAFKRILRGQE